jgi:hypothetical protein
MHKQENLIQVMIHLGTHDHLMVEGRCSEVVEQAKALLHEDVFHISSIISSTINVLVASKMFMSQQLFNEDGDRLVKPLKGNKLCQVMDKFTTLCSPNVSQRKITPK